MATRTSAAHGCRGRSALAAFTALAALAAGCSFGNLPYPALVAELDDLARVDAGTGPTSNERITWQPKVATAPWYMRFLLFVPLQPVLGAVFGERKPGELDNPSGHARLLVQAMTPKAVGDLRRSAALAQRFVRIAELDPAVVNRIVALRALVELADGLGLDLLADATTPTGQPVPAAGLEPARAQIAQLRPAARALAGRTALDPEEAGRYQQALETLVAHPLATWAEQLGLVADLEVQLVAEADPVLAAATSGALRRGLTHAIRDTLLRALQGQRPELVEVRLCAIDLVRRLGGPDAVPLILALMTAPPAALQRLANRFDPDPLVQIRLLHLCGQLDLARAERSVRLPGREAWEPVSPLDLMIEVAVGENRYYSPLRLLALDALSLCTGQPKRDYDVAWVQRWRQERNQR